jgi:hypothetical protein
VRRLHGDLQVVGVKLRLPHVGASRGDAPPGHHDLDQVGAGGGVALNLSADFLGAVDLAAEKPAVSVGQGQRGRRGEDAWTGDLVGSDRLAQLDGQGASVTEVAHGGDSAVQKLTGATGHGQH